MKVRKDRDLAMKKKEELGGILMEAAKALKSSLMVRMTQIIVFVFIVNDFQDKILNTLDWILDPLTGFWILLTGFWIPLTGFWILLTGF